jgi:hypothetical protein
MPLALRFKKPHALVLIYSIQAKFYVLHNVVPS